MTSVILWNLLTHRCTIVRAGVAGSAYGHQDVTYDSPAATFANIQCRIRSLNLQEQESQERAGRTVADFFLYLAELPDGMDQMSGSIDHRVSLVTDHLGNTIAENLDIQSITNPGYVCHHYQLMLVGVK